MSTESFRQFLGSPTQKRWGHTTYKTKWFFALRTMPESAYGEMLLGSLYRRTGAAAATEKSVAALGNDFIRRLERLQTKANDALLEPRQFRAVLVDMLDYPRTASQSGRRSLTLLPMVPELANYTAPVRLRGSPWNPGNLLADVVVAGAESPAEAERVWADLHRALLVAEDDDVWARFLAREVKEWRTKKLRALLGDEQEPPAPKPLIFEKSHNPHIAADRSMLLPARQFVRDLEAVIGIRDRLTRREWLAYLESLLRIGAVTHTQWLCRVHAVVWDEVLSALTEGEAWDNGGVPRRLNDALRRPWWAIGESYAASSRTLAQAYQRARYGLNLVLYRMEEDAPSVAASLPVPEGLQGLAELTAALAQWASRYPDAMRLREQVTELLEADPRVSACRKGFTNNLREFWLYGLAKRQPKLNRDSEFDQGYWLQKRGSYRSAPWVAAPGPLSLSLAAHCCLSRSGGYGTVRDLAEYLGRYGLGVLQTDFESGPLAVRLRGLGLVVDSPDAESGMGMLDPLGGA